MNRLQIYKIINPYLLKIINTNYIDRYITIDIIDFFYYFYNKDYNTINSIIIKDIKNMFKQNNLYLECIAINNNLFENTNKELTDIEILKVNEYINNYKNELLRIDNIYNYFKDKYDYNNKKEYKKTHLSKNIKITDNSIKSYCNIEEFIKPMKYYIRKKYNFNNNKKINEKNYSIIFILDRINKLFNDYIISLNYGIKLLTNEPHFIKYGNDYLPDIFIENFKIDNNIIYIKHLDLVTNINMINNTDKYINNNGYIKIYNTKDNNRINIYFE